MLYYIQGFYFVSKLLIDLSFLFFFASAMLIFVLFLVSRWFQSNCAKPACFFGEFSSFCQKNDVADVKTWRNLQSWQIMIDDERYMPCTHVLEETREYFITLRAQVADDV